MRCYLTGFSDFIIGVPLEALSGCCLLEETSQCLFCFFFRSLLQTVFDS